MTLVVRNQQINLPPPVESGWHASDMWCMQCGQPCHTKQFCRMGVTQGQWGTGPPQQHYGRRGNGQYGQGNFRGSNPGPGRNAGVRKELHHFCGRWHVSGQCWSEGPPLGCSNCGGNHPSDECRQPDKVINVPYPVANPQQVAMDNMRGERGQHGGNQNELRPPNIYYDLIWFYPLMLDITGGSYSL